MKDNVKSNLVGIRLDDTMYNSLVAIEKETGKAVGTIARLFVESALSIPEHEVNKNAVFTTISNLHKKIDILESKLRKITEVIND